MATAVYMCLWEYSGSSRVFICIILSISQQLVYYFLSKLLALNHNCSVFQMNWRLLTTLQWATTKPIIVSKEMSCDTPESLLPLIFSINVSLICITLPSQSELNILALFKKGIFKYNLERICGNKYDRVTS